MQCLEAKIARRLICVHVFPIERVFIAAWERRQFSSPSLRGRAKNSMKIPSMNIHFQDHKSTDGAAEKKSFWRCSKSWEFTRWENVMRWSWPRLTFIWSENFSRLSCDFALIIFASMFGRATSVNIYAMNMKMLLCFREKRGAKFHDLMHEFYDYFNYKSARNLLKETKESKLLIHRDE